MKEGISHLLCQIPSLACLVSRKMQEVNDDGSEDNVITTKSFITMKEEDCTGQSTGANRK